VVQPPRSPAGDHTARRASTDHPLCERPRRPFRHARPGASSVVIWSRPRLRRSWVAASCWPSPMSWVAPVRAVARLLADLQITDQAGLCGNRWLTVPR